MAKYFSRLYKINDVRVRETRLEETQEKEMPAQDNIVSEAEPLVTATRNTNLA